MRRKNMLKMTAAACALIGATTILFSMAAEATVKAKSGQVNMVSTNYQVPDSQAAALTETKGREGNKEEVNYHVSMDSLNTGTPGEVDLTMEEAAKKGTDYLKNIFGLDLKGAYVYMMYSPGTITFPRAFWMGDVLFEKKQTPESTRWSFMVDAVTGELFNIGHSRTLNANPSLDYDVSLEKNYGVYAELAKKKVEECGLMNGAVDRVEYGSQGYGGNDPDITMDVIGKNGEIVIVSFSRYDQTFLGLITDSSRRISESAMDDLANDLANGLAENYEDVEVVTQEFSKGEPALKSAE